MIFDKWSFNSDVFPVFDCLRISIIEGIDVSLYRKCVISLGIVLLVACTAINAFFNPTSRFEYTTAVNAHFAGQISNGAFFEGQIVHTRSLNNYNVAYKYVPTMSVKLEYYGHSGGPGE